MKGQDRAKEKLVAELAELRQRVAELEASEAERKHTEEAKGHAWATVAVSDTGVC